jgi:Predicted hydrolases or acyltransferases (alpha/beta hydrolase superfamily)
MIALNFNIQLPSTKFLSLQNGDTLAYLHSRGDSPGILYLPGFHSNMKSTKSKALYHFCQEHSLEYTAFDYYNHGESTIRNDKPGTIGRWMSDAIEILDHIPENSSQILVGSSMGAWIMMLLAQKRPGRVAGFVGIASAPDFTDLLEKDIYATPSYSNEMQTMGYCDYPTEYDPLGFYRIHKEFLEEAQSHFLLEDDCCTVNIGENVPLRLIHGTQDQDISHEISKRLFDRVFSNNKKLILVDHGDHRLSKPDELDIILRSIEEII